MKAQAKNSAPATKRKPGKSLNRKYGIRGAFVLYLGKIAGAKKSDARCRCVRAGSPAGFSHMLVLAGKRDTLFEPVLRRIRELKLENDVILPDFFRLRMCRSSTNAAEVFRLPVPVRRIRLPLIEAMACGLPVITSQGSSLEEVAGDAALLVDPLSESSIASAMQRMLEDSALRLRLRQAGLNRSKMFDFEKTAVRPWMSTKAFSFQLYFRVLSVERGCSQAQVRIK